MAPEPLRPTLTLADLQRWEDNGATWRALEIADDHAVVELCTCYGEPVDTLLGDAPELIAFVRAHRGDHASDS
jgi:hypothetical protein